MMMMMMLKALFYLYHLVLIYSFQSILHPPRQCLHCSPITFPRHINNKNNNNDDYYYGKRRRIGSTIIQMSLSNRILNNLKIKFINQPIDRVVHCWKNFITQNRLDHYLDEKQEIHQTADCYIEGLTSMPFFPKKDFLWVEPFEKQYPVIKEELHQYLRLEEEKGHGSVAGEWLAARDVTGAAYGPEWKTLGLQDRNNWNEELIPQFPQTVKTLTELQIPFCEAFFAKQGPKSGILPHSDKNNFIITCHLPLDVPEGECFIRVGNVEHYWKNGEACIFDTSIVHSTENKSERPRYILLLRIWHPELTSLEIEALSFIFRYLDSVNVGEEEMIAFERKELFYGKEQGKSR